MSELSKDQKKLVKLLKKHVKNDYDYVLGTLCTVAHPDDTKELIYYIENGDDVNANSVAAYSVYLANERDAPERNLPDGVPNRGIQGIDFD